MDGAPVKSFDVVARALSCVDQPAKYLLGAGDRDPAAASPVDPKNGGCDCSGFALWCLGIGRSTTDPSHLRRVGHGAKMAWLDTSAIVWDAWQPSGIFGRITLAMPGSLILYPDAMGRQGHVGVVIEADGHGEATKVAHCSFGNDKKTPGFAIRATGAQLWYRRSDAILCRFAGTTDLW